MTEKPSAYRQAGVDIDAKYAAVEGSRDLIRSTFTAGVVGDIGLFGGLFDLDAVGAAGQLLVASADGVGTKVKLARQAGQLGGIGEDLVNHCVNDILVQGARPLFFLDYIATAVMDPAAVQEILGGLAKACRENQCALLGGETAEMPGIYLPGELDVAGTIVGAVPRDRLLDGSRIGVGDRILALPSSGLHTNGYSLARKVLDDCGLDLSEKPSELSGMTLGQALLAVHRSYGKAVTPLLESDLITGMAHNTGGGLPDNLPRVLPQNTAAEIHRARMPRPPIFDFLIQRGKIDEAEAFRVFNMGFGYVLFVRERDTVAVCRALEKQGEAVYDVGEVVAGERQVHLR